MNIDFKVKGVYTGGIRMNIDFKVKGVYTGECD